MDKKGIQSKSADTLTIEHRLRNTQPGDVVTYEELSTLLGRDVREYCRSNVATARKSLIHDSIYFDTVENEGFRRLNNEEACAAASFYTKRLRRTARRGLTHLQHVKFDELSDDSKKKHLATSAQLGAIHLFSGNNATKRIESKVSGSMPIPIGETLKLFGS